MLEHSDLQAIEGILSVMIEQKFEKMVQPLHELKQGQEQIISAIAETNGRVQKLEQNVSEMSGKVQKIEQNVAETNGRVRKIEQDAAETNGRVHKIEQDVAETNGRVRKIEQDAAETNGRLQKLEHHAIETSCSSNSLHEDLKIVKLLLENDLSKKIDSIGEGHDFLKLRLEDALQMEKKREHMELELVNIRIDVRNIKKHVGMA